MRATKDEKEKKKKKKNEASEEKTSIKNKSSRQSG